MKATGIVRCVDDLGRVVIPKEIRKNLGIYEGESLEIYTENICGQPAVCFAKFEPNLIQEVRTLWDNAERFIPADEPNRNKILDSLSRAFVLLNSMKKNS